MSEILIKVFVIIGVFTVGMMMGPLIMNIEKEIRLKKILKEKRKKIEEEEIK